MERGTTWVVGVAVCICALTVGLAAQQQPPGSKTGNPTPGTPQPDPPNLADRITLTGCIRRAVEAGTADAARNPGNPSDTRFVLTKAERKNVVPPDTGTSTVAVSSTSSTYRLNAIDSQLSPFVETKVEISGEVLAPAGEGGAKTPVLHVEFVLKLSPTCS